MYYHAYTTYDMIKDVIILFLSFIIILSSSSAPSFLLLFFDWIRKPQMQARQEKKNK